MTAEDANNTSCDSVTWSQWVGGIVVANVVFINLEYLVYRALAPLERGEPEGGAVWAPIADVYELFGFGAAMSVIPILWFLLMSIIGWQTWARIKRERTQSSTGTRGDEPAYRWASKSPVVEFPINNPYESPRFETKPTRLVFPWGSTIFYWLCLSTPLAVGFWYRNVRHYERFMFSVAVAASIPILLAGPFAAAGRFVSRSSFRQRFYACIFVLNLLWGFMLLAFAALGLVVETVRFK